MSSLLFDVEAENLSVELVFVLAFFTRSLSPDSNATPPSEPPSSLSYPVGKTDLEKNGSVRRSLFSLKLLAQKK